MVLSFAHRWGKGMGSARGVAHDQICHTDSLRTAVHRGAVPHSSLSPPSGRAALLPARPNVCHDQECEHQRGEGGERMNRENECVRDESDSSDESMSEVTRPMDIFERHMQRKLVGYALSMDRGVPCSRLHGRFLV